MSDENNITVHTCIHHLVNHGTQEMIIKQELISDVYNSQLAKSIASRKYVHK